MDTSERSAANEGAENYEGDREVSGGMFGKSTDE